MIIRNETLSDRETIADVTRIAFETLVISNHTEEFIIQALRNAGALTLSLVAELDGRVVAHVAFSPVTMSDGSQNWHGLGPVSVLPELQKQGIGKSLIQQGLFMLKTSGSKGCVLAGDPRYYARFGFRSIPGLTCDGVPQEFFLALPFAKLAPQAAVTFHEGFSAKG